MTSALPRVAAAALTAVLAAATLLPAGTAKAAPAQPADRVAAAPLPQLPQVAPTPWRPRPEQYKATVTTRDIPIVMDDGVVLRGDLVRPA
ncbi:hypothetical protein, partial [Nocardioides sp. GCM10030258]|uniref:hypothetical protein n=1 Tax=unclassified Nocardioides TaxID=2615069 RepID=UPI0036124885